jgi:hypothetical protein
MAAEVSYPLQKKWKVRRLSFRRQDSLRYHRVKKN